MRKVSNKAFYNIIPVLGLMLLLVLSPCSVRNFLQAELGVQQTEVTNKSKTTISHSHCTNSESAQSTFTDVKSSSLELPEFNLAAEFPFSFSVLLNEDSRVISARDYLASPVPLYILYQNFKDYL